MPQRGHSSTSSLQLTLLWRSSNYPFLVGFFFFVLGVGFFLFLLHMAEMHIPLLSPLPMNSSYVQYLVVSSKDISESMDFSDNRRKFCKKKYVILICFEGASYVLTQLLFVWCSHTLFSWLLIPSPFHYIYSRIFPLFLLMKTSSSPCSRLIMKDTLCTIWPDRPRWLLVKSQKTSSSTWSYGTFHFAERFIKC